MHGLYQICDLGITGPDVSQIHRITLCVISQWFLAQIDTGSTGQGIGHYKRWRRKPVGFHQWVNTPFKVAVAREY